MRIGADGLIIGGVEDLEIVEAELKWDLGDNVERVLLPTITPPICVPINLPFLHCPS